ncbi:hypothetical protein J5X84_39980 [Streptosporangiaceae bacterium NEAU-GS5]|nr:hypothetical protein [Streptosporangiaceae bacterium NEAU-GS5]
MTHAVSLSELAKIVRAQEARTRRLGASSRLVGWVGDGATGCVSHEDGKATVGSGGVCVMVLLEVLADRDCWPADELRPAFIKAALQEHGSGMAFVERSLRKGDPFDEALRYLLDWAIVEQVEGAVRLTALGRHVGHVFGMDEADLAQTDPDLSAADLLALMAGRAEDDSGTEVDGWLAARAPVQAADELLFSASTCDPLPRVFAITLVKKLGAAALPAWNGPRGWRRSARWPGSSCGRPVTDLRLRRLKSHC